MGCPACGSPHFYNGIFGPDCGNKGCKNFKNGTVIGDSTTIVKAEEDSRVWTIWNPNPKVVRQTTFVFKTKDGALQFRDEVLCEPSWTVMAATSIEPAPEWGVDRCRGITTALHAYWFYIEDARCELDQGFPRGICNLVCEAP